jgi:hypothetical protein
LEDGFVHDDIIPSRLGFCNGTSVTFFTGTSQPNRAARTSSDLFGSPPRNSRSQGNFDRAGPAIDLHDKSVAMKERRDPFESYIEIQKPQMSPLGG